MKMRFLCGILNLRLKTKNSLVSTSSTYSLLFTRGREANALLERLTR